MCGWLVEVRQNNLCACPLLLPPQATVLQAHVDLCNTWRSVLCAAGKTHRDWRFRAFLGRPRSCAACRRGLWDCVPPARMLCLLVFLFVAWQLIVEGVLASLLVPCCRCTCGLMSVDVRSTLLALRTCVIMALLRLFLVLCVLRLLQHSHLCTHAAVMSLIPCFDALQEWCVCDSWLCSVCFAVLVSLFCSTCQSRAICRPSHV